MDEYVVLRATAARNEHRHTTCLVSINEYNGDPLSYFKKSCSNDYYCWEQAEEVGRIEIQGDVKYLEMVYEGQE